MRVEGAAKLTQVGPRLGREAATRPNFTKGADGTASGPAAVPPARKQLLGRVNEQPLFARSTAAAYPAAMYELIQGVGLVGDGDETHAIDAVERRFGITLDPADAPGWKTAGDLFASVRKLIPEPRLPEALVWARFAEALTEDNGVDPRSIRPESPLILRENNSKPAWRVARWLAMLGFLGALLWVITRSA